MIKDHSDSERGNPLPPHGLLFPVLLYAPSHRKDSTYHALWYTSCGGLDRTRNIHSESEYSDTSRQINRQDRKIIISPTQYLSNARRTHQSEVNLGLFLCFDCFNEIKHPQKTTKQTTTTKKTKKQQTNKHPCGSCSHLANLWLYRHSRLCLCSYISWRWRQTWVRQNTWSISGLPRARRWETCRTETGRE